MNICRPVKAFIFYSGYPDVCTAIIIMIIILSRQRAKCKGPQTNTAARRIFRILGYISSRIFETAPEKGQEYSHRNPARARFVVTAVRILIGVLLSWLVSSSSSVRELTCHGVGRWEGASM